MRLRIALIQERLPYFSKLSKKGVDIEGTFYNTEWIDLVDPVEEKAKDEHSGTYTSKRPGIAATIGTLVKV